jgi:hypothetical protein
MRWAQRQRIDFIAERLRVRGFVNRADLQVKFEISTPQASTDLREFQALYPNAMTYNTRTKRYERGGNVPPRRT